MMDSKILVSHREMDGCTVIDIQAENFTYPQSNALKTYVADLIAKKHYFFVLNMSEVKLVDSYGLATVISVLKMIKESQGGLALYGLSDFFVHLVKVTHLDRVLEVWPSEAQAVYYLSTLNKAPTS